MHHPDANKALFVIPSQFNSVEYPNSKTIVKNVAKYTNDNTGGPVAQLAADVGLAACLLEKAASLNNPLNSIPFVSDFPNLHLQNGYLKVDSKSEDHKEFVAALKVAISETRLTIARNVPVCGFVGQELKASKNRIDIAYASGVPFAYRDSGFLEVINTDCQDVCKLIMYAQYASALKYAVDKDKTHVYLMLLGGKTFNNELIWIENAIKQSYISASIYSKRTDKSFPKITIITYTDEEFLAVSNFCNTL